MGLKTKTTPHLTRIRMKNILIFACSVGMLILVFICIQRFCADENPKQAVQTKSVLDVMAEEAGYPVVRDQYGRQLS